TSPTTAATASAITRPVRFMRLIPHACLAEAPREFKGTWCPCPVGASIAQQTEGVLQDWLLRWRRLLAANLDVGLALQQCEIAAPVATGEDGADRDQQRNAANAAALHTDIGLGDRFHDPLQMGAPQLACAPHPTADFLTNFRRM